MLFKYSTLRSLTIQSIALKPIYRCVAATGLVLVTLTACLPQADKPPGFEVKFLVGSALKDFCQQAADRLNPQKPKLPNGKEYYLTCEAMGSGDVVTTLVSQAKQVQAGTLPMDAPQLPTIASLDGEIYHNQLKLQLDQVAVGGNYIPEVTDSPLLASSPLVFMAPTEVAQALVKVPDPFTKLVQAQTHRDIDASGPSTKVYYVQTAPTRSNSGLQTLIAQFAAVSGKRPEQLTLQDVQTYQNQVQQIQRKVTRYGLSTNALATAMVQNGPFWASIGSVYESSVIMTNSNLQPGQPKYQAVYPKATYAANMRAIKLNAPWVNADETAAAEAIIQFLRSPETQKLATDLGLRPGESGVALGPKFSPEFGVQSNPQYDSYRSPQPAVVDAMLKSWSEFAKKPSLVVVVVDSSGSMQGNKLPAVQQTLQSYIHALGPKEQLALMDFDDVIRLPVLIDGTPQGKERGLQFISSLQAQGGTKLYDATLAARNWLQQNLRKEAINGVLILTDGEDSGSTVQLDQLGQELQKSGFNSDQRIGFFTVGYGNEGEFDPDALKKIADLNGGYYSKGNPETINQVMSNLQVEF
ncbi:MAG: extracellular solute-binding protein [Synechococcales bacterium]|nr:extracellular solute-binding protein [Synechococcales bacterium]